MSDVKLEIVLAGESPTWCGQIYVREEPGALSRLFGAHSVARDAEVLRLAQLVDRIVRSLGANAVLWRIDGPPEQGHGAPSPEAPTTKK